MAVFNDIICSALKLRFITTVILSASPFLTRKLLTILFLYPSTTTILCMPAFSKSSIIFSIKVVDSLYLRKNYRDEIFDEIVKSELPNIGQYRYSDLGFYLLSEAITRITGTTIDKYAYKTFYGPLGLQTMGYRPLNRFHKSRLVPTEQDNYFRFRKIQGYVHDMGAAMLGGVSGHAGLFSNARDMAILMQMLLNKGMYGGNISF